MKILKALLLSFLCMAGANTSFANSQLVFEVGKRPQKDILRDSQSKGPEIVEFAGVKENMQVLDILGGGGYYSEILNEKVGQGGKVYLHNNQAYMPWVEKELNARFANNRLENVIRWDREVDNLGFEEQSFDAIFFVLGYHDMYHTTEGWNIDKDDFLAQLTKALKVGGKLLVIDHSALAGTGTQYSQETHRIAADYVKEEVLAKGFKFIKESDLLANPNDNRLSSPFTKEMRRKTDRFVLLFEKK